MGCDEQEPALKRVWLILLSSVSTIAVCGVLIVGAEYLLRVRDPLESLYVPDDHAIARYKPDLDKVREVYGQSIRFTTNRFGVRHDQDLAPGEAQVLVLGDSNVAALFLPFEQTLGQRLAAHLQSGVTVLDLAVPGYGPDQSVNRFKAIAADAHAKAVVLHFFADNDFGDLFRNNIHRETAPDAWKTRDDLARDPELLWEHYRLFRSLWTLSGLGQSAFDRFVAGDGYYPPFSKSMGGSVVHSQRPDALAEWKRVSELEYQYYRQGRRSAWQGDHYDYAIAMEPDGPAARAAVRVLAHVLWEAKKAFRGADACFVLLIQPAEDDLMDDGGTSVSRRRLKDASANYHPRAMVDLAIRAAGEAGVPYLDLFPVFSTQPARYYYPEYQRPRDNHWNAGGVDVAAKMLAEYLGKNRCL
jgi:hypothetical protein